MNRLFGSLAGRLLFAAVFWTAAATSVGGWLFSYAFESYVEKQVDTNLELAIDTMVGVSQIDTNGVLVFTRRVFDSRFEKVYSGWYWQVSEEGKEPFRSRSLWDHALDVDMGNRSFSLNVRSALGPDGQQLRLMELDVILPESERIYRFMAAADSAQMQSAIDDFDRILFLSLAAIAATIVLGVISQLWFGLKPIRAIGQRLSDVREGRRHRLEGQWPREIDPMATEINALIDHNEKIVERARTHVGNLAHALKTPLSVIRNECDDMDDGDQKTVLVTQVDEVRRHIDHHLKRARVAGAGRGTGVAVKPVIDKLVRAMAVIHSDKELEFYCDIPEGLSFAGELEDFNELAGNLVDNAAKWANSYLRVTALIVKESPRRPYFELIVEDDGVGVSSSELDLLFERGMRFDEHVPGTGLGLAIVRDIAEMYGGQVSADHSKLGGLKVSLVLPRTASR